MSRALLLALLCVICLTTATGYTWYAVQRNAVVPAAAAEGERALTRLPEAPALLFRSTAVDDTYGRLAAVPLAEPGSAPEITSLDCERVAFAAGRGICLTADRGAITTYRAFTFGPDLEPQHELALAGIPSRARLSPDGRVAAVTVFVSGHSYAEGGFSTQTTFFDAEAGQPLGEMEQFAVERDGAGFSSLDFNFWGVTFAPEGNRFYATLSSRGATYLVEGDLAARTAKVLRENVECPSLSPDGTRLVFKKRIDGSAGRIAWRLHLLELATMTEVPLPETRSVDDQVTWLDDDHIAYGLPNEEATSTARTDTWTLAVSGDAVPELLLSDSWSAVPVE